MISIEALKEKVKDIPPLPELILRLLAMCRDPDTAPRDIVEVIRHDPAITVQVLRLCNSTFYGFSRKITSLQEAMVYIGTDALVNFVLAAHLYPFYQAENQGYGLERGQLWRQAVGTAVCAQRIAERVDPALAGVAFTCGLLHCVGKTILDLFVADEFSRILDDVEAQKIPFLEAEEKNLGVSHSHIGAEIAEHWGLSDEIIESIRYYANPLQAPHHKKVVAIVHTGNMLRVCFGIGVGSDGLAYAFHPDVLDLLQLRVEDLFALSIEIQDRFKRAEGLLHFR